MFDKYYLKARLAPTILTALPLMAVYKYIASPYISEYINEIVPLLPAIEDISFSIAIVLFLVQINRRLSKEVLEKPYFKSEIKFPTTDLLLYSNSDFSTEAKDSIRLKIKNYFNLTMLTQQEESNDEQRSRLLIKEAVSQIREVLRNNELLLNHNIEYGGARNFLGGCVQAIVFSLILIVATLLLSLSKGLIIVGSLFLVVYTGFLLFGRKIITMYGNDYARILYQQFMYHTKQP